MGAQRRTHFSRLASFFVLGGLGSQNDPQGLPQEPPRPVQASMFIDFATICYGFVDDVLYHVAHLLSSLPLCFCYLEPYFSSFGVVSGVISELRSTARWWEGRRQVVIKVPTPTPKIPRFQADPTL